MKMITRTKLTDDLRKLSKILDAGDTLVKDTASAVDRVSGNREYSLAYQEHALSDLKREHDDGLFALGSAADELMEGIEATLDEMDSHTDLNDSRLMNALNFIRTMGNAVPFRVRHEIIETFRGEPGALRCLKVLYEQNGFDMTDLQEALKPFDTFNTARMESRVELVGYATTDAASRSWRPSMTRLQVRDLAGALGLDLSRPGMLQEAEHIRQVTRDAAKRDDIDAKLKVYTTDRIDGSEGAASLFAEYLNDWRAGEPSE